MSISIPVKSCPLCSHPVDGTLTPNGITIKYSCHCGHYWYKNPPDKQPENKKAQLQELLEFREYIHKRSLDLVVSKGHDYNRAQQENGDTLFNLKVAAILGIVDLPERGILVRLTDKLMRLISLLDAKEKHESFEDTVVDIHNYVDYLAFLRKKRLNGN